MAQNNEEVLGIDEKEVEKWWNLVKDYYRNYRKGINHYFNFGINSRLVEGNWNDYRFGTSGSEIMDQFISNNKLKWIPYNKFEYIEDFDKGGFGTIYKAKFDTYIVILKSFNYLNNSDESLNEFLNEWKIIDSKGIIKIYGFTKNSAASKYKLIMQYINKGNIRGCLAKITKNWEQRLLNLYQVIDGLNNIHEKGLIHYNFHDGNILCNKYNEDIYIIFISDYLGLYQLAKSFLKENNIYGIIPFMAPEILKGQPYTQASDIYSFSMIMWEFTSGISPFNDKAHDLQLALDICKGKRPEIIENTPQCYVDLMKKCWNEDPLKRPSSEEVFNIINNWMFLSWDKEINEKLKSNIMEFINAPIEHNNLIIKSHPKACYTSHLLDFTSKELNEILEGSQELKSFELEQKNDDAEKKFHELEKIAEIYYQSSQNELKEIQIYCKQTEEENLKLENEVFDLQQRNSKFEQYNQKLRLELAMQIKEFAKKEITFQTQIIDLQNEKQSLASSTEQLKQNNLINQQVQIQISQLEQEKIDLQEKLTQTKADIQELKSQKESSINQKEQLEIKLNQLQVNYEQIEQEKIKLLSQVQKLTKSKSKLEREIVQLEQKLNNEKQIEIQLTQALQIKEDKINESEQKLINLDYERIKKLKEEMNEIDKELLNILSSGKNTSKIHKEKKVKQKEMEEFKQEFSRTSASYNANRKKWVFKQVNNFLKAKGDFLTLQEEAIEKLQNCCNYLESSVNKERNTVSSTRNMKTSEFTDKYTKEFQNIFVEYNNGLLELDKKFSSLKETVQENKELEVSFMIGNILKLNSYSFNKYKIKFSTNFQRGTRIQLNFDIRSLRKNLNELKLELTQETKELKNLAEN